MPNHTDAKTAAASADTLDDHGFTKVKSKGSPGQKKQTKGAKQEPIAAENPFGVLSDEDDHPGVTNRLGVDLSEAMPKKGVGIFLLPGYALGGNPRKNSELALKRTQKKSGRCYLNVEHIVKEPFRRFGSSTRQKRTNGHLQTPLLITL